MNLSALTYDRHFNHSAVLRMRRKWTPIIRRWGAYVVMVVFLGGSMWAVSLSLAKKLIGA